jgi:phage terminase Nu1 subunit (DNA packaging protein)
MADAATVNDQAVAKACNISIQRVGQLVREGVIPKKGRGEYELGPCMAAYIRYLQKVVETRGPASTAAGSDIATERRKLIAAQREKVETENAIRRGDLTECVRVAQIWANNVSIAKANFRTIPSKLGPQLTGISETAVVVDLLQTAIDEVLTELAGADDGSRSDLSRRAPDLGAATQTNDKPVGGHAPEAV